MTFPNESMEDTPLLVYLPRIHHAFVAPPFAHRFAELQSWTKIMRQTLSFCKKCITFAFSLSHVTYCSQNGMELFPYHSTLIYGGIGSYIIPLLSCSGIFISSTCIVVVSIHFVQDCTRIVTCLQ